MNATKEQPGEPIYLNKSKRIYKIYFLIILFILATSLILNPILGPDFALLDFLIGLPALSLFVLIPLGFYYNLKSFFKGEGQAGVRLRCFIGHGFFMLLVIISILVFIYDVKALFR